MLFLLVFFLMIRPPPRSTLTNTRLPDTTRFRSGAGELLPAKALGTQGEQLVEVPLTAPVENIPSTLRRGSRVDVYVIPERVGASDPGSTPTATKVLEDVAVIAVPEKDDVIGQVGSRQILVGVSGGAHGENGLVIAAARDRS